MECNLNLINCLFLEFSHLIFPDCGWPWVTKTMEHEMVDKARLLYLFIAYFPDKAAYDLYSPSYTECPEILQISSISPKSAQPPLKTSDPHILSVWLHVLCSLLLVLCASDSGPFPLPVAPWKGSLPGQARIHALEFRLIYSSILQQDLPVFLQNHVLLLQCQKYIVFSKGQRTLAKQGEKVPQILFLLLISVCSGHCARLGIHKQDFIASTLSRNWSRQ